ncbi:MAG: acyl-CoA dehydrogenase family protein, partial [Stellaceae bacterium]
MGRGSAEHSANEGATPEPAPKAAGDYVARVRELAPVLAAAGAEIDRRRELPGAIVDALIERGLFRLLLPASLGGAELLPAQYVPIIEELAKIDASIAWCVNQNSGCSMTSAYLAPEAAREIFGHPRGILAWGPGPGEARAVAGGYQVTATWAFASGSHHASWLGCHVPVIDADGRPRLKADGTPEVRTMLFPKSVTQ